VLDSTNRSATTQIDGEALRWLRRQVGDVQLGERLDAPFGEALVQRVVANGRRLVLKRHRSPAGYAAEAGALRRLAMTMGAWLPEVVATSEPLRTLLLREIPGKPGDQLNSEANERRAHHEAGRFMAALQARPVTPDRMLPDEAIARRLAGWLRRSGLPDDVNRLAAKCVDPTCFRGSPRVEAHRDFQPGNWLLHGARLVVLDFGHARSDVAMADRAKLAAGPWRRRPALRAAFDAGFGAVLTAQEEQQLSSLCALHGLATAVWGDRHGDQAARAAGMAILVWCAA